jgi:hypothetical protein
VQVGREGTTSNGEGECEGRGRAGAPHAKTRNTRNAVAHRLLAGCWLLGWDGMGWDSLASNNYSLNLWGALNQGPRLPPLWLLLQLFTELPAKAIYDSLVT